MMSACHSHCFFTRVGLVAICGCCGKDVATPMFLENENIEVRYNGALLDRSSWDLFPNEKCGKCLCSLDCAFSRDSSLKTLLHCSNSSVIEEISNRRIRCSDTNWTRLFVSESS